MSSNTNLTGVSRSGMPVSTVDDAELDPKVAEARAKAAAAGKVPASRPDAAGNYDGTVSANKFTSAALSGSSAGTGISQQVYDQTSTLLKGANLAMPNAADLTRTANQTDGNPQIQTLRAQVASGITDPSQAPSAADLAAQVSKSAQQANVNPYNLMVLVMLGSIQDSFEQSQYEVRILDWYNSAQKQMIKYVEDLGKKRAELDDKVQHAKDKDATKQQVQLDYKMTDVNYSSPDSEGKLQYKSPGHEAKTFGPNDIKVSHQSAGYDITHGAKIGKNFKATDPRDPKKTQNIKAGSADEAKQKMADVVNQDEKSKSAKDLMVNSTSLGEELTRAQQRLDMLGNLQQQRSNKFQSSEQTKQQSLQMLTSIIKSVSDTLSAIRRNM